MSFFESKTGKNVMAKAYALGAAVVITGALFKIMHFPFAGELLTLGMSVEALIFVISAFEPLPQDYHWEIVYPELVGEERREENAINSTVNQRPTISRGMQSNVDINVDQEAVDGLNSGIRNFTKSLEQMSGISSVMEASNTLTGSINKASASMMAVSDSTNMISDSYQKNAVIIQNFNEQSKNSLEQMRTGYDFYRSQLETLGQTMGAVNSSYELYLQEAKKVQVDYANLHGEVGSLLDKVKVSIGETQNFSAQMSNLNNNVSQLNSVYGNMLAAVNTVLNK